jgi:hypothetical protein
MRQAQDVVREYVLRLLGYKGEYFEYSNNSNSPKTL